MYFHYRYCSFIQLSQQWLFLTSSTALILPSLSSSTLNTISHIVVVLDSYLYILFSIECVPCYFVIVFLCDFLSIKPAIFLSRFVFQILWGFRVLCGNTAFQLLPICLWRVIRWSTRMVMVCTYVYQVRRWNRFCDPTKTKNWCDVAKSKRRKLIVKNFTETLVKNAFYLQ